MMRYHFSLCLFLFLFHHIHCSYAIDDTTSSGNGLVDEVCKQTSNYKHCVDTVYSDSRAVDADAPTLADVVFRLAYKKATATQRLIIQLLNNASSHSHVVKPLQRCSQNYNKGVEKLEGALNDLNSETYDGLAPDSRVVANGAADCQAAFNETHSPLTTENRDMKFICEICVAVSKEFTGGQS